CGNASNGGVVRAMPRSTMRRRVLNERQTGMQSSSYKVAPSLRSWPWKARARRSVGAAEQGRLFGNTLAFEHVVEHYPGMDILAGGFEGIHGVLDEGVGVFAGQWMAGDADAHRDRTYVPLLA